MAKKNRRGGGGARQMSPFVIGLIVSGVIGVGIVGYTMTSDLGGSDMVIAPVEFDGMDDMAVVSELATGVTFGDPTASITIIEFADFSCPHCMMFQQQIKPRLDLAYVQEGIAKFEFHDFPLGMFPHSFLAARAARCAGDQDAFLPYHDTLFRNQSAWSVATNPARQLLEYAETIGIDRGAFEACLRSAEHADVVTANQIMAEQLGLPGTPAVLVRGPDGTVRNVETSFEAISEAVESLRPGS